MPRPQRCRRVCSEPEYEVFSPDGIPNGECVRLSIDEYELIRLIDLQQLTHAQAAEQMDISRPSATLIYNSARVKIADSLVNGKKLLIAGGKYRICNNNECGKCIKQQNNMISVQKGKDTMRIAVTYENEQIFQHFGHTEQFKFYDVENNTVINTQIVSTNGSGHGALAGFLKENKADALICGGIGGGAQNALAQAGIKLYGGVSGNADDAIEQFISGKLSYNPDVKCNHHGSEHSHSCGTHNCGSHSCH